MKLVAMIAAIAAAGLAVPPSARAGKPSPSPKNSFDLKVSTVGIPDPFTVGGDVTWSVRVVNVGSIAAPDVYLRHDPGFRWEFRSFHTSRGSCAFDGPSAADRM